MWGRPTCKVSLVHRVSNKLVRAGRRIVVVELFVESLDGSSSLGLKMFCLGECLLAEVASGRLNQVLIPKDKPAFGTHRPSRMSADATRVVESRGHLASSCPLFVTSDKSLRLEGGGLMNQRLIKLLNTLTGVIILEDPSIIKFLVPTVESTNAPYLSVKYSLVSLCSDGLLLVQFKVVINPREAIQIEFFVWQ